MRKLVLMMLLLLLVLCVAAPALAMITPNGEIWIKQGEKVTFTASWPSDIKVVKVQWTMDGEIVWEKKVNEKKSPYASSYTLHAQQFAVKYDDDYVGSYELFCFFFDTNGPLEPIWGDISVFIEPRRLE